MKLDSGVEMGKRGRLRGAEEAGWIKSWGLTECEG